MAWTSPQWGVGAPGGSPSTFAKQPNSDAEPILSQRTGRRDFGQVAGLDGIRYRWGGGERGGMSNTEFMALVDLWETHAVPNAGRVSLKYFDYGTGNWETDDALMSRPTSRPRGGDTTGPRHFDVVVEFTAIGIP